MNTVKCGAVLVAATVAISLAACASSAHRPDPARHSAASPAVVAPSATPTPTPIPTPTVAGIVIGPDGIGPLVPGQNVPNTPETAALLTRDPAGCNSDSDTGAWDAVDPAYKGAIIVATTDGTPYGRIYSLGTFKPVLKTALGVGVDDTLAQLQAAYPRFDATVRSTDTTMYVVNGTRGHLIFEVGLTDARSVSLLNPGEPGHIISIRSEPLSTPVESVANTDGYSNCHG